MEGKIRRRHPPPVQAPASRGAILSTGHAPSLANVYPNGFGKLTWKRRINSDSRAGFRTSEPFKHHILSRLSPRSVFLSTQTIKVSRLCHRYHYDGQATFPTLCVCVPVHSCCMFWHTGNAWCLLALPTSQRGTPATRLNWVFLYKEREGRKNSSSCDVFKKFRISSFISMIALTTQLKAHI